ncbi:hypothetical protein [uncultured Roseibium sp.]|uniref:hypothetical protein n=1 Tax=uncultured Roseibium sp. TaxID=1936171 RepID=UPI0032171B15
MKDLPSRCSKSTYPPHIAEEMKPGSLPVIQKPMGDGCIMEVNLALDWEFNRDSYMRLASAAIHEFNAIIAERQGA